MKTQQKRVLQVRSYCKSNLYLGTSEAEHHKIKLTASAAKAETKSTGSKVDNHLGWPQVCPLGEASFQRAVFPASCLCLGAAERADLERKRGRVWQKER